MRLYLLRFGTMQPGNIPVAGYLVQTDDGTNVLVDTGWPRTYVNDPQHPPGLTLEIEQEDTVVVCLASLGLTPSDIDFLICSHLDDDHSGNHDLFPDAELIVQRSHYDLATSGHPRFSANRHVWDHPGLRYRLIDGDIELLPGVHLLETSGHVPGHQSVLVVLPQTGPIVLAIDAVMDQSMADAETREMWVTDWIETSQDEARVRKSTRKIAEIAESQGAAFFIYGHDAKQWTELRIAPEFYE